MTYTIETLKDLIEIQPNNTFVHVIDELVIEVESLTRQLRAEEITGLNMRLRTARECAQIAASHLDLSRFGNGGRHECAYAIVKQIRDKFEVPA